MAKYTNKKGELIKLTDEHVETAIRIKIELQNMSPSGKCNWSKHKKLMEEENFFDSENSEVYRCLIKNEQKKMGTLPSAPKYADFVTDKKLESLEKMVGEVFTANRETQAFNRELNKTKRSIADEMLVIKELKSAIAMTPLTAFPKEKKVKNHNDDLFGIITPADWHIGLVVGELDHEVALKRIKYYAEQCVEKSKLLGITDVYVTNLGDVINHIYMHKNTQAFNSEFNMAEQMVKAVHLSFAFLKALSAELNVTYLGTIVGNHGRFSDKKETLTDDNVEVVIHEMIKTLIDTDVLGKNLSYDDSGYRKSILIHKIAGRNIAFVHGDKEAKTGADRLKKYSSIYGMQIDLLIQGHTHNFKVESENYNRKIITSGSLMGADDYAQGLGLYTGASQEFIAISKTDIIPVDIALDHIK